MKKLFALFIFLIFTLINNSFAQSNTGIFINNGHFMQYQPEQVHIANNPSDNPVNNNEFLANTLLSNIPRDDNSILGLKLKFGVLAGSSYYILDKNDILTIISNNIDKYKIYVKNAELGIHFGMMVRFQISKLLLQPEFIFNSNVINYHVDDLVNTNASTIAKEKYQYFDIPVMVGYKSGFLRFMGGPVGHVFINNKSDLVKIENFSQTFKSLTVGYQAGLGLDIGNFLIDLRYEGNLTKLGAGIKYMGKKVYFSQTPGRVIATLTFLIN